MKPVRQLRTALRSLSLPHRDDVTGRVLGVTCVGPFDAPVTTEVNGRDRMMAEKTRLTDARARAFAPPPGREGVLWDADVTGFGLRVLPGGSRSWVVHRRRRGGVLKRTLGPIDALPAGAARSAARRLLAGATADTGGPAPTLRAFAPVFLADCAPRWKPATRMAHAHNLREHIVPAFGRRRVDAVTARDVRVWFDDLACRGAGTANRTLAVLSSLMRHAEELGLRPDHSNPCRGLRRRRSGFTARYLADAEFAALGSALAAAEHAHPVAVAVLRFLLFTGARKSEALGLRWEHVHGGRAVLPDSKTGPRTIWLSSPARAVLTSCPRRCGCPWVFPSVRGEPVAPDRVWHGIRRSAGLSHLRIHDLRHSHAAAAVNSGFDLRIVAGLLGHADIKTTFGYAHLAEAPLFAAANRGFGTARGHARGRGGRS